MYGTKREEKKDNASFYVYSYMNSTVAYVVHVAHCTTFNQVILDTKTSEIKGCMYISKQAGA